MEQSLRGVDAALLPVRVIIAGGAAALFHASTRPSRDIDAVFSLRVHLSDDLSEAYLDREGNPASVYLDRAYNDALGPMHEDAVAASE
ncbi:MAG: hypothetical protein ABIU95_06155, partial [Burkholderiales bacterium]